MMNAAHAGVSCTATTLDQLERRYERLAQFGTPVIALLAFGFAALSIFGRHVGPGARIAPVLLILSAFVTTLTVGYFLATMTELRREIARQRAPSRAERVALMRRVGELSAVIDAGREIESAGSVLKLCERLAVESESLVAGDAALVVLRKRGGLAIAAATHPVDRDDVALASQAASWEAFLEDGGMPYLAATRATVREGFGEGPLADRYDSAMEVPLLANGTVLGLVIVLRRTGSESGFDADGLKALGLLADVASHIMLLKRMNARVRRTNRRLVESMEQLRRAQGQLVQSERMRAVGELVSGVAHELSNPLTSLLGFAHLLSVHQSFSGPQRQWVEEIEREASRCTVILKNLLGFARTTASEGAACAPATVVVETLALKAYDLRKARIAAKASIPPSLPAPALDRQDLQQVLLNLINNAIAAMRNATVRTLSIRGAEDGDDVVIEVADSGCGIPPADLERVFEPFYSTKPAGDAIGLGLTTCRKIVNDRGGSISVRSEVGVGSTFTLRLPRAPAPVPA